MKTRLSLFILVTMGIVTFAGAEENLVKNGDFSDGSSRWSGKKNIEFETAAKKNKVCKMFVKKKRSYAFYQTISASKKHDLIITFRLKKSDDYKGKGYRISSGLQTATTWYWDLKPPKKRMKWKKVKLRIKKSHLKNSSHFKFIIKVKSGSSGYLMFDDFKIVEV